VPPAAFREAAFPLRAGGTRQAACRIRAEALPIGGHVLCSNAVWPAVCRYEAPKLGVATRVQAVVLAYEAGLVRPGR
jgi:hypothetical protein